MEKIKVATAFSGGFGSIEFALKYEEIPHEVVFACEFAEPQRKSYINNHSSPKDFYKDIKELDGKKHKNEIDLFHLSPPCQSYSTAGRREGLDSEKGNLMIEAIRVISEVEPKVFIIENVKGLLSTNKGKDWTNILKDLSRLKNYTISSGIMNARNYGTPQNRERVFIVGFRGKGGLMSFPLKVKNKIFVKDIIQDNVDDKYYLSKRMLKRFNEKDLDKNNGFSFNPHTINAKYIRCLTARYAKMGMQDPYLKDERGVRKFTPRECARAMGDFKGMFLLDGFSNTKLYEFIGNAIDISTYRALLKKILNHLENIELNPVSDIEFKSVISSNKEMTLMDFC